MTTTMPIREADRHDLNTPGIYTVYGATSFDYEAARVLAARWGEHHAPDPDEVRGHLHEFALYLAYLGYETEDDVTWLTGRPEVYPEAMAWVWGRFEAEFHGEFCDLEEWGQGLAEATGAVNWLTEHVDWARLAKHLQTHHLWFFIEVPSIQDYCSQCGDRSAHIYVYGAGGTP